MDICLISKLKFLILDYHVKKGKLHLHDYSEKRTYSFCQQPLMLHSAIIMPCTLDVGVVILIVIIILWEEGVGHSPFILELDDSHVGHVLSMAP